ncbi:hypothetical protein M5X17_05040 [Paenibacillus alvei]|nr:hypothetical protein [Paenibacillus alvei]MCY9733125.1 hypothetical protein [Paenibacillus alvei]
MFMRDTDTYIRPEKTLQNMEEFLKFVQEKGWSEDELYFVVKLTQAMFD